MKLTCSLSALVTVLVPMKKGQDLQSIQLQDPMWINRRIMP
jgi:hypothetical protein